MPHMVNDRLIFSFEKKDSKQKLTVWIDLVGNRQYAPHGQRSLDFSFERRDSKQKLTIWIGLVGNGGVIGQFFFRRSINGETYLAMLID